LNKLHESERNRAVNTKKDMKGTATKNMRMTKSKRSPKCRQIREEMNTDKKKTSHSSQTEEKKKMNTMMRKKKL
jgi:hypothetical protein